MKLATLAKLSACWTIQTHPSPTLIPSALFPMSATSRTCPVKMHQIYLNNLCTDQVLSEPHRRTRTMTENKEEIKRHCLEFSTRFISLNLRLQIFGSQPVYMVRRGADRMKARVWWSGTALGKKTRNHSNLFCTQVANFTD